jgi:hypothetical protein
MSILETLGILMLLVLSFVFHILVYEDDYIEKWYWKLLSACIILGISFTAIMGY